MREVFPNWQTESTIPSLRMTRTPTLLEQNDKTMTKTTNQPSQPSVKEDKDFRDFFLPQTDEERLLLEESILKDGCREPLVVWKEKGILIDGYHRYKICKKHNKSYKIRELRFKDKEEVRFWMWNNQRGRRNVSTLFQKIEVVLKIKDTVAEQARERQLAGVKGEDGLCKQYGKKARTNKILGDLVGASHVTVGKVDDILNKYKVSEEEIAQLRSGKVSISSIHDKYNDEKGKRKCPPHLALTASAPQWRSLTSERKNELIRGTFDDIANKIEEEDDRLEFARMVIKWANSKVNKTST